jgi:hypothetical protein
MGFLKRADYAPLEKQELISNVKNLSCRRNTFQKLTQFSLGNKVIDGLV